MVVTFNLAFLPVLLEQPQKVKNFVISLDANDSLLGVSHLKLVLAWRFVPCEFVLNLLHELNELIKRDLFSFFGCLVTIWKLLLLPNLGQQVFGLLWVSLQALHDGIQVRGLDRA